MGGTCGPAGWIALLRAVQHGSSIIGSSQSRRAGPCREDVGWSLCHRGSCGSDDARYLLRAPGSSASEASYQEPNFLTRKWVHGTSVKGPLSPSEAAGASAAGRRWARSGCIESAGPGTQSRAPRSPALAPAPSRPPPEQQSPKTAEDAARAGAASQQRYCSRGDGGVTTRMRWGCTKHPPSRRLGEIDGQGRRAERYLARRLLEIKRGALMWRPSERSDG